MGFSTWSLRVLAGFLIYNLKLVDKISHSEIRNIFLKHNIKWRKSKTVLSNKRRYDENIQNVYVVLDNLSVHKSKKIKDGISKYYRRLKFVFLRVRSPELNLIEVRWSWLQRQAINNSTFKDEQEIGQAVSTWKDIYNKNHDKAITNILQEYLPLRLQSC